MSLSSVGAPGLGLPTGGTNRSDAERWKTTLLPSGDQLAELPRVRNSWWLPSCFITNRSEPFGSGGEANRLTRLLSNTIVPFPSGDNAGSTSRSALSVKRRAVPSMPMRYISAAAIIAAVGLCRLLANTIVDRMTRGASGSHVICRAHADGAKPIAAISARVICVLKVLLLLEPVTGLPGGATIWMNTRETLEDRWPGPVFAMLFV